MNRNVNADLLVVDVSVVVVVVVFVVVAVVVVVWVVVAVVVVVCVVDMIIVVVFVSVVVVVIIVILDLPSKATSIAAMPTVIRRTVSSDRSKQIGEYSQQMPRNFLKEIFFFNLIRKNLLTQLL